jgi:hypothetical protein
VSITIEQEVEAALSGSPIKPASTIAHKAVLMLDAYYPDKEQRKRVSRKS